MPYTEKWFPGNKKREDAEIGNTAVWPIVERAKKANVSAVMGWRRDKTIGSAANELRCFDSVTAINETLQELIREKKEK